MRVSKGLLFVIILAFLVLPVLVPALADFFTEWLWFDSVGYQGVFQTRLLARWGSTIVGLLISLAWWGGNLWVAMRLTGRQVPIAQRVSLPRINLRGRSITIAWIGAIMVALLTALAVGDQWETLLRYLPSTR